ncbi:hypothetical protein [Cohaesibacter intestini]|uniref:hypothetical protein n=1 Tax=Cohaesibacter intestini TaxID=2211145 RepID=UPI000DE879E7|nr:hypothetical protein [Cohaesibacter intestini]
MDSMKLAEGISDILQSLDGQALDIDQLKARVESETERHVLPEQPSNVIAFPTRGINRKVA